MGQNQLINYNLESICQASVINTLSGLLLKKQFYMVGTNVTWYAVAHRVKPSYYSEHMQDNWSILIIKWDETLRRCYTDNFPHENLPPALTSTFLESVVRRVLLNAQKVTLGGRRLMTCSYPPVPGCKVMETAVWSRCQGHYQRKGLPAVAPSHRKLPTHPNKERHKCTCCCLQGERDKMTL